MSQGAQTQYAIDTENPLTQGFEVDSETLTLNQEVLDANGMRGSRSHRSERTADGNRKVEGSLILRPSYEDLQKLVPLIMGGDPDGNLYPLAEVLPEFYVQIDKVVDVYLYSGCKVNKATFESAEGAELKLTLDVIAKDETPGGAGTFPEVSYANTQPFLHSKMLATLLDASRQIKDFKLTVDNMLEASFYNSFTATRIMEKDRVITVESQAPWTADEIDLYQQALAGAAAQFRFYDSRLNLLRFDIARLQVNRSGPTVGGKTEIPLRLNGTARMFEETRELETYLYNDD